jgi:hypothetical protein
MVKEGGSFSFNVILLTLRYLVDEKLKIANADVIVPDADMCTSNPKTYTVNTNLCIGYVRANMTIASVISIN